MKIWTRFINQCPCRANLVKEIIRQKKWRILKHPPYNQNSLPCHYHIFGPLNHALKDRCSVLDAEVQNVVKDLVISSHKNSMRKVYINWRNSGISVLIAVVIICDYISDFIFYGSKIYFNWRHLVHFFSLLEIIP